MRTTYLSCAAALLATGISLVIWLHSQREASAVSTALEWHRRSGWVLSGHNGDLRRRDTLNDIIETAYQNGRLVAVCEELVRTQNSTLELTPSDRYLLSTFREQVIFYATSECRLSELGNVLIVCGTDVVQGLPIEWVLWNSHPDAWIAILVELSNRLDGAGVENWARTALSRALKGACADGTPEPECIERAIERSGALRVRETYLKEVMDVIENDERHRWPQMLEALP